MDAQEIVAGLGGADILEIEPCPTRLRVVVGPQADTLTSDTEDRLG